MFGSNVSSTFHYIVGIVSDEKAGKVCSTING